MLECPASGITAFRLVRSRRGSVFTTVTHYNPAAYFLKAAAHHLSVNNSTQQKHTENHHILISRVCNDAAEGSR